MRGMTTTTTDVPGFGHYDYDPKQYDAAMATPRAELLARVLTNTDDGRRTAVRKLRKPDLAAMVADWETAAAANERHAEALAHVHVCATFGPDRLEDTGGGCYVAFFRTATGMVAVSDEMVCSFDAYDPDAIGDGEWLDVHETHASSWSTLDDLRGQLRALLLPRLSALPFVWGAA